MGVKDLSRQLRNRNEPKNSLEDLEGKTVGFDLSVLLHKIYIKKDFAVDFHSIPKVCMYTYIAEELSTLKATCDKHNITIIFYADGCSHPGKAEEDKKRSKSIEEKTKRFRALQLGGNQADKEEILKLMAETCYTREDIMYNVKTCCKSNNV